MTAFAGATGHVPSLSVGSGNPEAAKYGRLWERADYRECSPGELLASTFAEQAHPKPGATLIDFGCGTGRGGLNLALFSQMNVTLVDFVRNCLDEDIRNACETQSHTLRFHKADLEQPLSIASEYGFCCDVMEHIPPEKVEQVLNNILQTSEHVFFSISTREDQFGAMIGEKLHLTVQSYAWWLEQFTRRECMIHWSKEDKDDAFFYVSAWKKIPSIMGDATLNTADADLKAQVKTNCEAGWQQVTPREKNESEIMILGGGPSLNASLEEIREKKAAGMKVVTLNGVYNWAYEHDLFPVTQVMIDARPFNARFTKPVDERNMYLIGSQCHPSVLEGLPHDRTYLWHTNFDLIKDEVLPSFPQPYPIPSCATVLNTSIILLRMLGFCRFHLYGCDSCLADDQQTHHAYAQPENDDKAVFRLSVTGGRIFWVNPWMASQAQEFMEMIKFIGHEIELCIYGDGLLKHILDAGAAASITSHEGDD